MVQGGFSLFAESPFDIEPRLVFDQRSRIWDFQTSILELKSSHWHDETPRLSIFLSDDKPLGHLRDTAVEEVLHETQLLVFRRENDLAAKVPRQTLVFARLVPHVAILAHGVMRKFADSPRTPSEASCSLAGLSVLCLEDQRLCDVDVREHMRQQQPQLLADGGLQVCTGVPDFA